MADPLALHGGRPVRGALLPYGRHLVEDDDVQAVVATLRDGLITTGPAVTEFERAFAAAVGARHAVAVSSGTAALHAAVFAAGLGPGDEAVTTPLTFVATSNAVQPAICCSRAKVTSKIEFADATPTAMIAPISEGTLRVVPVMKSIVRMPQNVAGKARMTTNGSPKFW